MIDIHSVSAGGGSIAWVDAGGALRVGPHSAGASWPGRLPAGWHRPDRDRREPPARLPRGRTGARGARSSLPGASERALAALGGQVGLNAEEVALGVIRVANTEMAAALRVISVARGLDPREFALIAFGGAGPMHACGLAEELGMGNVLVPRASGVQCALGLAISDLRRDDVRPFFSAAPDATSDRLLPLFEDMQAAALEAARTAVSPARRPSLQRAVVRVDRGCRAARGSRGGFHSAHERRYGYRAEDGVVGW